MSARILIVDDEPSVRRYLTRFLEAKGYEVVEADDGAAGLLRLSDFSPDVVLLDLRLPDMHGVEVLERIHRADPGVGVVVITGHGDVETAVQAMKAHADHFMLKPVDLDVLETIIQRLLARYQLRDELEYLRGRLQTPGGDEVHLLLPEDLAARIRMLADSDTTTVLLLGETGTGKGFMARLIHDLGPRSDHGFVDINCAGLAGPLLESELFGHEQGAFTDAKTRKRGLLEFADQGSLFLDEIGDMPLEVQSKLLKVIEDKSFRRVGGVQSLQVDTRIMAATNIDLEAAVRAGRFRQDLFYRLSVVPLELPPLRQRRESIPGLARRFLSEMGRTLGKPSLELSPAAERVLVAHGWPGNIRELRNVIERAVLLCSEAEVEPRHLPETLRPRRGRKPIDLSADNTLAAVEARHIQRILELVDDNRSQAAELLGVHRSTLIAKIKKYGLG